MPALLRTPWVVAYVLDPLERSASTFVQQFLTFLLGAGSVSMLAHQSWAGAADAAGFAAVLSLVTSVATFGVSAKSIYVDLVLRVVKTFGQSLLGIMAADTFTHSVVHADWSGALALALTTSAAALLKGLAAMGVPGTDGASLLSHSLVEPTGWNERPASAGRSTADLAAAASSF